MVISGVWPCQSDPIANGPYQGAIPCVSPDPRFHPDTYNWLFREVDLSLSNWWYSGPTATTPNQPQVAAATPAADGDSLPSQLAYAALDTNVECGMAQKCFDSGNIDHCQADLSELIPTMFDKAKVYSPNSSNLGVLGSCSYL